MKKTNQKKPRTLYVNKIAEAVSEAEHPRAENAKLDDEIDQLRSLYREGGIGDSNSGGALVSAAHVERDTVIDSNGHSVFACVSCREAPAATCQGCGGEGFSCPRCLADHEDFEVEDLESGETVLLSCPECADSDELSTGLCPGCEDNHHANGMCETHDVELWQNAGGRLTILCRALGVGWTGVEYASEANFKDDAEDM